MNTRNMCAALLAERVLDRCYTAIKSGTTTDYLVLNGEFLSCHQMIRTLITKDIEKETATDRKVTLC